MPLVFFVPNSLPLFLFLLHPGIFSTTRPSPTLTEGRVHLYHDCNCTSTLVCLSSSCLTMNLEVSLFEWISLLLYHTVMAASSPLGAGVIHWGRKWNEMHMSPISLIQVNHLLSIHSPKFDVTAVSQLYMYICPGICFSRPPAKIITFPKSQLFVISSTMVLLSCCDFPSLLHTNCFWTHANRRYSK